MLPKICFLHIGRNAWQTREHTWTRFQCRMTIVVFGEKLKDRSFNFVEKCDSRHVKTWKDGRTDVIQVITRTFLLDTDNSALSRRLQVTWLGGHDFVTSQSILFYSILLNWPPRGPLTSRLCCPRITTLVFLKYRTTENGERRRFGEERAMETRALNYALLFSGPIPFLWIRIT